MEEPVAKLVVGELAGSGEMSAVAGWDEEPLGRALVFRLWPARVLRVVGDSLLAAELRRLLRVGAAPGGTCIRCRPDTPRFTYSLGRCIACPAATGSTTCWS